MKRNCENPLPAVCPGPRPAFPVALLCVALGAALGAAPGVGAQPSTGIDIPHPDLSDMSAGPRERLGELRDRYEDLREEGASPALVADAAGLLGQMYLAFNHFDSAAAALENAEDLAPTHFPWVYYLGVAHQTSGRLDSAAAAFERARSLRAEDLANLLRLGDLYLQLDRIEEARRSFAEAAQVDAESAAASYGLGRVAIEDGDYATAVELFERVLESQPGASAVQYPLGQAYRRLGEMDLARGHLQKLGDVEVAYPDPLGEQVAGLILGNAFEALLDMAGEEPFDERNFLGFALSQLGESYRAAGELRSVLVGRESAGRNLDRESSAARAERTSRGRLHYALGGLLIDQNDDDGAERELRNAVALVPELADARIKIGNIRARAGDLDGAISAYSEVLRADPDHRAALRKRGATYMLIERDAAAVSDLERLRELEPEEAEPVLRLASIRRRGGDPVGARTLYLAALELDLEVRENAATHFELGNIARDTGAPEDALREYETALATDASLLEAGFQYATVLGRVGRFDESAAAYARLLEQQPDHEMALLGQATAHSLAGRETDARKVLDGAVERNPQSLSLTQALARLLASARDPALREGDRAVELATQAVTAVSSFENAETLAMALAEAGRYEEAAQIQRRLVGEAEGRVPAPVSRRLRAHLELYETGRPCCVPPP